MILCPHFVFIHVPKNGGTFVKTVMQQIAGTQLRPKGRAKRIVSKTLVLARGLPRPLSHVAVSLQQVIGMDHVLYVNRRKRKLLGEVYGQHNTCRQIPPGYRNLPIVAVMRNPFDRYVSLYRYGQWRRYERLNPVEIRKIYPTYPDIDFKEFLEFANGPYRALFAEGMEMPEDIGLQTLEMIDYFAKDRLACLQAASAGQLTSLQVRDDFFSVRFLRQEALNQDFSSLLTEVGYAPWVAALARDHARIRPRRSTRTDENEWRPYYDATLLNQVLRRERLIFELFPEYLP